MASADVAPAPLERFHCPYGHAVDKKTGQHLHLILKMHHCSGCRCVIIASLNVSGGVDPPFLPDGDATPSPVGTPPVLPPVPVPARAEQGCIARVAPKANEGGSGLARAAGEGEREAGGGRAGGADLRNGRSAKDVEEIERKAVLEKLRKPKTVPQCIARLKEAIHHMEAKMAALDWRCSADQPRETKGRLYAAHWRCTSLLAKLWSCLGTLERTQYGGNRYTLAGPFTRATSALETSHNFLEECSALEDSRHGAW